MSSEEPTIADIRARAVMAGAPEFHYDATKDLSADVLYLLQRLEAAEAARDAALAAAQHWGLIADVARKVDATVRVAAGPGMADDDLVDVIARALRVFERRPMLLHVGIAHLVDEIRAAVDHYNASVRGPDPYGTRQRREARAGATLARQVAAALPPREEP